jgi:Bacterial regulatory helix-turn-helix protein, lysR family
MVWRMPVNGIGLMPGGNGKRHGPDRPHATFVRVVECGSFSSVARELGLGQPAVSKQVAALEANLGAELIRRTSRR